MKEPSYTAVCEWHEAPPREFWQRISDTEFRSPERFASCILWRNRWVILSDEVMRQWADIERQFRSGEIGLEWVKAP